MSNDGRFLNLESGKEKLDSAIETSSGASDGNKIAMTDSTGRGADTLTIEASENLSAGDFVNIFNDAGTAKVRKADATNSRDANGFVLAGVTAAADAEVYFEGTNTQLSGMTIGARQYLDTTGGITETPKTGSGELHQYLGKASSATEMNVELDDCILIG